MFLKKNYPIINIVSRINDKIIIADPDYKRGLIWDNIQQSRFIESILLGLPIPSLFFEIDDQGRWIVIDGTQRLMTIKKLFDSNLVLTDLQLLKKIEKQNFEELPNHFKHRLEDYSIETVVVDLDIPEQIKLALFERLNLSGANISSQELRNYFYRKTSFPLLRKLHQYIENKIEFTLHREPRLIPGWVRSVEKSHAESDEFILKMLSFYFVSEKKCNIKKLGIAELDYMMKLIENEDDERLIFWFSEQCAKINSAFENKGIVRVFKYDNKIKNSANREDNRFFRMGAFLIFFGVVCSLPDRKLQKNINQIIKSVKRMAKVQMLSPFEAINQIIKGLK